MGKTALVSIIVPAYKVEHYLLSCLQSIARQNYNNIEVIVVNDGSPDKSGAIAELFCKTDNRFRVIHTKNMGVSSARNTGIEESVGDYICFVDSDDELLPDFVDYMLMLVGRSSSGFALSRNCFKSKTEKQSATDNIKLVSGADMAAEFLYPRIDIGCWNKIYSRDLLDRAKLRFLTRYHMGEGLNFIVSAALACDNVCVGERKVYFYRKDNLNSATTLIKPEKFVNALMAIDNIRKSNPSISSSFNLAIDYHTYITTFYGINSIIRSSNPEKYRGLLENWRADLSKLFKNSVVADIPFSAKLKLALFHLNPVLLLRIKALLSRLKHSLIRRK